MPDAPDLIHHDTNTLWDEGNTTVSGGTNWADDIFDADNYLTVIGPEFNADHPPDQKPPQ